MKVQQGAAVEEWDLQLWHAASFNAGRMRRINRWRKVQRVSAVVCGLACAFGPPIVASSPEEIMRDGERSACSLGRTARRRFARGRWVPKRGGLVLEHIGVFLCRPLTHRTMSWHSIKVSVASFLKTTFLALVGICVLHMLGRD